MFKFEVLHKQHIPLLKIWLRRDHIQEYWQETDDLEKLEEKFLNKLPEKNVCAFVIKTENDHPIGYIQYYNAKKVGDGWWESEDPETFGLDLMIGDDDWYGKGLASIIIRKFIFLMVTKEPSLKSIIADPKPTNTRAIRAFEKSGFEIEKYTVTPDGDAVLMRFKV